MDCIVVERDFRKKGLNWALQNCVMITGLEVWEYCSLLILLCEQNKLSHQIYTQHFGFSSHIWLELSPYPHMYTKEAKYYVIQYKWTFETREVVPLIPSGLLVKDNDAVSRADTIGLIDTNIACTIHHTPASELGDTVSWISRQFDSYLVEKETAKERQMYVSVAHFQEKMPSTAYSTYLFVNKRMLSFGKLLPTLEDGSSGEAPAYVLPYDDANILQVTETTHSFDAPNTPNPLFIKNSLTNNCHKVLKTCSEETFAWP